MRRLDPKALDSDRDTMKLPDEEPVDDRQYFVFYQDEGGYRATDEFNEPIDTIYYLGIIDICTPYNAIKKVEHLWKGLRADRVSREIISARVDINLVFRSTKSVQ